MNTRKLSARIVPQLEKALREAGLMTSVITLDAPRFRHYLKKPANLLHDHWTYLEKERTSDEVVYRLGSRRGLRQELSIDRKSRQATLSVWEPNLGLQQVLVYDLAKKIVLSNTVTACRGGETSHHQYIYLTKKEGLLKKMEAETLLAA